MQNPCPTFVCGAWSRTVSEVAAHVPLASSELESVRELLRDVLALGWPVDLDMTRALEPLERIALADVLERLERIGGAQ